MVFPKVQMTAGGSVLPPTTSKHGSSLSHSHYTTTGMTKNKPKAGVGVSKRSNVMEKLFEGEKRWRERYNICSVIKRCLFIAYTGITNLSRMQFHFRPSLVGLDKKRSSSASKYLPCPSRLCCCASFLFFFF